MDVKTFLASAFGQWLMALVVVGIMAGLGRLAQLGAAYLHRLRLKAEDEHRSVAQMIFLRVSDVLATCAADAVSHVEATMRPKIIGAAADGKLDAAQAKMLRDEAIKLAIQQAKSQFGAALMQAGITSDGAIVDTIAHLIDLAAEKIGGKSTATGVAPPAPPSKPEMKTTNLSGQPVGP